MSSNSYCSEICAYCPMTNFGDSNVNSAAYNLCEGRKCPEAYERYREDNPEDNRTLEEMC